MSKNVSEQPMPTILADSRNRCSGRRSEVAPYTRSANLTMSVPLSSP